MDPSNVTGLSCTRLERALLTFYSLAAVLCVPARGRARALAGPPAPIHRPLKRDAGHPAASYLPPRTRNRYPPPLPRHLRKLPPARYSISRLGRSSCDVLYAGFRSQTGTFAGLRRPALCVHTRLARRTQARSGQGRASRAQHRFPDFAAINLGRGLGRVRLFRRLSRDDRQPCESSVESILATKSSRSNAAQSIPSLIVTKCKSMGSVARLSVRADLPPLVRPGLPRSHHHRISRYLPSASRRHRVSDQSGNRRYPAYHHLAIHRPSE